MIEVGQFVEIPPASPKGKPRVGIIVGICHDRRAIPRLVKVYIRTAHQVVGVPPKAVKAIDCPPARKEGNTLVTGRGLVISLETGYPV